MSILRTRGPRTRSQTFRAGPWKGVHESTGSRFETTPEMADALTNGWIPDPVSGSEVVCRPGTISGTRIGSNIEHYGQGSVVHTDLDGTIRTFAVCGGALYRYNTGTGVWNDVTPVGVAISTSARVYMTQFLGQIIVTDRTNRPWRMTNLGSTPVTGTYIDYDGSGTAWTAWGKPTIYAGKVFFICNLLNGVSARNAIMWSEEADASVGYQQSGYDNLWELTQNDTDALHALHGTNGALYYFRADSIGLITGAVDTTFQTTATHDAVSASVGTTAPDAVTQIGDYLYFVDQSLRPFRLALGSSEPEPLWMQMRRTLDALSAAGTASLAASGIEVRTSAAHWPAMDVWVVAAGGTATNAPWVFDTRTGRFLGTWSINGGASVDHIGLFCDSLSRVRLFLIATSDTSAASSNNRGYPYTFNWPGDESVYARDGNGVLGWTAITLSVKTHPMGLKERAFYAWQEARFEGEPRAGSATIAAYGGYATDTLASITGTTAAYEGAQRFVAGLAQTGPFCQVTASLTTTALAVANWAPRITSVDVLGMPLPLSPTDR